MIQLRTYQSDAIESLRENIRHGHTRQVLAAPTGAGKSIIMMEMLRSAMEKRTRMLFLCERRILVEQFSAHLDSQNVEHGVLMSGHWRFRPDARVQVASVQTLEHMDSWPDFDFVFIDELHACMRKSVVNLIEKRPNMRMIGASATPFHPLIGKHFSAVVNVRSMHDLVQDGNLVPFRVFIAKEIDTEGLKVVAGEWKKDDLETRGRKITGDVVADYLRISNDVFGGLRKTICFSCGIAHGEELVQQFAANGINAIQLASGIDEELKSDVLKDFARPDSKINVLISVDMLSRGFDQCDIEHVIVARPLKKSFSTHVQMIGRGARPYPGKNICVVQDHCSNFLRFLPDWEVLYRNGVQSLESGEEKPRKEPTKKEKEAAKCPKCGAFFPPGSTICLHCGHVRTKANAVINTAGEMMELSANGVATPISSKQKKEEYTSEYKQQWYEGMIGLLRSKGKNENRAYHLYKEKFGVAPPWKKEAGPISADVIGFLQRANIAFAKGRKFA